MTALPISERGGVLGALETFEDAALQHLRDGLSATTQQRWQWLQQAMTFGFATARDRAAQGQITLGPHGDILWSPLHEALWTQERRLPSQAEIDALSTDKGSIAPAP